MYTDLMAELASFDYKVETIHAHHTHTPPAPRMLLFPAVADSVTNAKRRTAWPERAPELTVLRNSSLCGCCKPMEKASGMPKS